MNLTWPCRDHLHFHWFFHVLTISGADRLILGPRAEARVASTCHFIGSGTGKFFFPSRIFRYLCYVIIKTKTIYIFYIYIRILLMIQTIWYNTYLFFIDFFIHFSCFEKYFFKSTKKISMIPFYLFFQSYYIW